MTQSPVVPERFPHSSPPQSWYSGDLGDDSGFVLAAVGIPTNAAQPGRNWRTP